jgi:alginate O-acetyltransferase complex protein AlgI
MLFSSPVFFAFFAIYFVLHLITPRRARILLIIAGSTIFYAWWKVSYVWLPYLLTAIAYLGVKWIERASEERARKRRLFVTIVILFVPLVFFKYTDFLYRDVVGPLFGLHEKILDLPLPLGVSFVTFTLTAYVVDIYRGTFAGRASPTTLSGYVLFFPHLIAGPILRPIELIPQLRHPRSALSAHFYAGLAIFTIGLVKKLVFADQIAAVVDAAYKSDVLNAPAAWLAIYGFSIQIYCDFSGYTDMAIGLALLIGIRLPNNFLRPYGALSLIDFWRRWHITLSFWLRDYLYIPLGGNRGGRLRTYVNMLITMTLGGLWHGASWTFVIWGVLHGIGVAFVHLFSDLSRAAGWKSTPRWWNAISIILTFHFVTLLWVFFRAPSFDKARAMLAAAFAGGGWNTAGDLVQAQSGAMLLLCIFAALHAFDDHRLIKLAVRRIRPEIVLPLIVLLWALAMTLSHGRSANFIYFDF